jgi:hypothetical protein
MLVIRVPYNARYIKPKYGYGFFNSFARFVSNAARKVGRSTTVKKALHKAISEGKSGLSKAAKSGSEIVKAGLKNPAVRKGLQPIIDAGAEFAVQQINKGIDSSISHVKEKIDKKLPSGTLQNTSNLLLDAAGEKVKALGKQKVKQLTQRLSDDNSKTIETDNIPETKTKTKKSESNVKSKTKRKSSTKSKTGGKRQKIDWGDQTLNSLIARQ